jgi:DNA-binding SARP family transcriptional activator
MLKALVAFGAPGVSEELLSEALWPDSEGDKAHQAFATTLHRLRQLVGTDRAVQLRDGRVTIDPRYCWVDAYAFERLLEQAEFAEKKGDLAKTLLFAEKAVSLYKGPFLEDIDEPWAFSFRERLRSKFLRAARKLGDHLTKQGHYDAAIEFYQKGLEVDNLAEIFYQHLMICHLSTGRKAETLLVYDRCHKIFSSVLGVMPSQETEELRRQALKR